MKIAIPTEIAGHEHRVAATPETVKKFVGAGVEVVVQKHAGVAAHFLDSAYEEAGAHIEAEVEKLYRNADAVFKVQRPQPHLKLGHHEAEFLKEGTVLIGLLQPLIYPQEMRLLAERRITTLSLDMVPRIARAQKLDALSSQSNIAGYKAVLMAANTYGKIFPMMMTAAGTILPTRVLVIGAGVAGLQAIATARRLGAVVEAMDTRPAVKEQVESLGAKFVALPVAGESTETKEGYAKELSKETHAREEEVIAEHVRQADIVITTALIPGKPAPKLISEKAVEQMKPGSVIVDLAAEAGGNCELTAPGKLLVKHGVTLISFTNVPSLMAQQSSIMYARNVANLFFEIFKNGRLELNPDDEIVRVILITRNGEIVHPAIKNLI